MCFVWSFKTFHQTSVIFIASCENSFNYLNSPYRTNKKEMTHLPTYCTSSRVIQKNRLSRFFSYEQFNSRLPLFCVMMAPPNEISDRPHVYNIFFCGQNQRQIFQSELYDNFINSLTQSSCNQTLR